MSSTRPGDDAHAEPIPSRSEGALPSRIGVVLVAGNRLLREALSRVLNKRSDITVLASLAHGPGVEAQIPMDDAQVVLCDALSAAPFDIRFVQSLTQCAGGPEVVLIGMEEDRDAFLAAVSSGVVGYVLNEASAMDVVSAVRAVARGEAVCPPRLTTALLRHVASEARAVPVVRARMQLGLTRREQQLLPLLAGGLTNKEIASQLSLSEQTVKNHVHRMLRKTGVADRLGIVDYCRLQGLEI